MAPVLKTGVGETLPGVRIPPSPPPSPLYFISGDISQESRKYARIRCTPMRTQRRRKLKTTLSRVFENLFSAPYLGSSVRRTRNQSQVRIQAAKIPTGSSNSRFPATQSPGLLSPATSPKNRANSPHSTHSSVNRTREITSRQRF
jgi:hypothetical protein